jgi:ABC-type nitrate/sulfonate/bicarbonate transport system substrate-binding protein
MTKTAVGLALAGLLLLAGCSSPPPRPTPAQVVRHDTRTDLGRSAGSVQNVEAGQVLRLGYLADLASAPALAGLHDGLYTANLRSVNIQPQAYLSDLDEVNALEHGQLDAAYLDPVAAVQAWQDTTPGSLAIISGATTGPSELIARPGITRPAQLAGTRVEAPADASQAALLDQWLARNHLTSHVSIDGSPVTPIGILQQFTRGTVTAAWESAPLAQQLIAAGGHILATATATATTTGVLVITTRYLDANPAGVAALLQAQAQACAALAKPAGKTAATQQLAETTGTPLTPAQQAAAFTHLTCTSNPGKASIRELAAIAATYYITRPAPNLATIYKTITR